MTFMSKSILQQITRHTSHVSLHTSHVTGLTSHVTLHTWSSRYTPHLKRCGGHPSHVSYKSCHASHVTRHLSHVTCHTRHLSAMSHTATHHTSSMCQFTLLTQWAKLRNLPDLTDGDCYVTHLVCNMGMLRKSTHIIAENVT